MLGFLSLRRRSHTLLAVLGVVSVVAAGGCYPVGRTSAPRPIGAPQDSSKTIDMSRALREAKKQSAAQPLLTLDELRKRLGHDTATRAVADATPAARGSARPDTRSSVSSETPTPRGAESRNGIPKPSSGSASTATSPKSSGTNRGTNSGSNSGATGTTGAPVTQASQITQVSSSAAPTTPGVPQTGRWIKRVGRRQIVSVTFTDDALGDVLSLFSAYSGLSIIPSDEKGLQDKTVSGEIHDQPWYAALEALLDANGLRPLQDSTTGIITVVSRQAAIEDRVPYIIRLRYADAPSIQPTLQKMVSEPSSADDSKQQQRQQDAVDVVASSSQNAPSRTLVVYTSSEKLKKVLQMIKMLDKPRPTVMISAKLALVNRSKMERLGFSYSLTPQATSTPATSAGGGTTSSGPGVVVSPIGAQGSSLFQTGGTNGQQQNTGNTSSPGAFSFLKQLAVSGTVNLNLFLDVTQSIGMAEVATSPSVSVLTDEPATISVGEALILPQPTSILTATGANNFGTPQFMPNGQQVYAQTLPNGQVVAYPANGGSNGMQPGMSTGAYGGLGTSGGGGWGQFQTGTTLKVTPYVLPSSNPSNSRVRLRLDITRDGSVLGSDGRTISGPKQSAQSDVIVADNEILAVAGLTTTSRTNTVTGIPILKDVPLFGKLFKHTETAMLNEDLVIIVQPHIIYEPDMDDEPIVEALPAGAAPPVTATPSGTKTPTRTTGRPASNPPRSH